MYTGIVFSKSVCKLSIHTLKIAQHVPVKLAKVGGVFLVERMLTELIILVDNRILNIVSLLV